MSEQQLQGPGISLQPSSFHGEREFISDILQGLKRWRLWYTLGWKDIRARYRRTVFGPFWTSLSVAVMIGALGVVYAHLWHIDVANFLPFLSASLISWTLLSTIVSESCSSVIGADSVVRSMKIPYSIFIYRIVWRNLVVFGHSLVIHAAILLIFLVPPTIDTLLLPLGLAIVAINGIWIGFFLGTLCARFRDVVQLVASIMQILFFVTPIFWQPDRLDGLLHLVLADANLVYHLLEIVRRPMLGEAPSALSYAVTSGSAVIGLTLTGLVVGRFYRRIAYWL
jgi:ABC-type polysaccharide/polyol phosphate export permease